MGRIILSFAAGATFFVSIPPFALLPAAALSFAALAVLIKNLSARRAAILGYVFGFAQFIVGISWISESFSVEPERFGSAAWLAVLALAAFLALFPAISCAAASRATRHGVPIGLAFATAWTFGEWLRGHLMTGFPWNLAAYSVADWPILAQSASVVGSYGLSFVLVYIFGGLGIATTMWSWKGKLKSVIAPLLLLISLVLFGLLRLPQTLEPSSSGTPIRIVQPNISQTDKWAPDRREENIARLLKLSGLPGKFRLLLWPETAWPGFLMEDSAARAAIASNLPADGIALVGTTTREVDAKDERYFNSIVAIGWAGFVLADYSKHHLVPFGEYVPLRRALPLERFVSGFPNFSSGPGPRTFTLANIPLVGATICYEAIFPGHVIDSENRPAWIFNATNDAWFGSSIGPSQHLASARMRAIEEGIPLVRAANTGISVVTDSYGRILASLQLGKTGVIDARLPRPLPTTVYAAAGDWTVVALIAIAWIPSGVRLWLRRALGS